MIKAWPVAFRPDTPWLPVALYSCSSIRCGYRGSGGQFVGVLGVEGVHTEYRHSGVANLESVRRPAQLPE